MLLATGIRTLVITGPEAFDFARTLFAKQTASTLLAASISSSDLPIFENRFKDGETLIYQCLGSVCQAPVSNPDQVDHHLL